MIREKTKLVKVNDDRKFDKAMEKALFDIEPKNIRAIQIFATPFQGDLKIMHAVIIYLYDTKDEDDDEEDSEDGDDEEEI